MTWMETDYSKHTHFRWKIKWRLEDLGALGIMGEAAPWLPCQLYCIPGFCLQVGMAAAHLNERDYYFI